MRLPVTACLLFPLIGGPPEDPVAELRTRAREILTRVERQALELPEARVEVEQLRRTLVAVGERDGWTPTRRTLEMAIARPDRMMNVNFDDCPLFYEEELVALCPLDAGQSEIWGNQVIVCEFLCAPRQRPGD